MKREDIPDNISEARARGIVLQALVFNQALFNSRGITILSTSRQMATAPDIELFHSF